MSEHLLKLLAAYAAGTAATAFLVRLVWLMPIESIAKHLLSWILPLPAILIALVLSYYGPRSYTPPGALPETPGTALRVFLLGAITFFIFYAFVPTVKFIIRRVTGSDAGEEETEDE